LTKNLGLADLPNIKEGYAHLMSEKLCELNKSGLLLRFEAAKI